MSKETQRLDFTGDNKLNRVNQNMDSLINAVRHLPADAINDLLSIGVCVRCIGRLFGICELVCSCSSVSPSIFYLGETTGDNKVSSNGIGTNEFGSTNEEAAICSICLGILQFMYSDKKDALVKKSSADDFCSVIAQLVKNEGHAINDFSLEVSVPPVVSENEQAIWMYMKKKYGAEQWAQENLPACTPVKEALKISIADSLEKFLGVKSGSSPFHIRLTFTQNKSSKMSQNTSERNQNIKRTKQGTGNGPYTVDKPVLSDVGDHDVHNGETEAKVESSLKILEEDENIKLLLVVREPCCLALTCCKTHIYFGGRYLKYSRNVSQTRWIIDDERMGEASVEEIIGGSILPLCHGDNFKFHAAGREDIDVRMLGSGRPFLIEIQNPRRIPSDVFVKEIESKINHSENKLVKVKSLKLVDSQGWNMLREGEAEKQKQYAALVWISRPLEDIDVQALTAVKELQVSQKTPIRVLHRRSPMERGKIIHWMNIERIAGTSQYFLLHLCTQAGTYIKEFVHGDLGRTKPSVGSILGCRAEILQLDVTDVKMDCFLDD